MYDPLIIVQARCSSKRLKNKVLMSVKGTPLIVYLIERLRSFTENNNIIIATSDHATDDPLTEICKKHDILYFRGSLQNVAMRFRDVIKKYDPDTFIRISGDSPLIDQKIIKELYKEYINHNPDICTNVFPNRTFPKGQSVEIIKSKIFLNSFKHFSKQDHLEHVTKYFYENSKDYNILSVNANSANEELNLSVDEPEDFEFVSSILKKMKHKHIDYDLEQIIKIINEKNL